MSTSGRARPASAGRVATSGKPLKWLAITDEYTRECLALEVDRSITADKIVDVLANLFISRGVPKYIRSDNGPEFIAGEIRKHAAHTGLEMLYVEPGAPCENGFAESFFSRLRKELLNCKEFENVAEARWFARRRKEEHNEKRPHSSLKYQTPLGIRGRVFRGWSVGAAEVPNLYPKPNRYSHNPRYRKVEAPHHDYLVVAEGHV